MKIKRFDWNQGNIDHIARHQVEPDEAEEVFVGKIKIFRSKNDRYVALGKTLSGRYLFVVFMKKGRSTIRVITARDMTVKEKRLYKR
ncbi:MAG: BrnT family toxin [bacterium]|nr:BrnT family toxin [bacterium]MBU1917367.1 BrnT family toxin [bacterium]